MSDQDFLLWDEADHVVTLTMNSPETRNALSYEGQFQSFVDALERINRDMDVRCVILTGAGSAFCAGGNIKDMRARGGMFGGSPYQISRGYKYGIQYIPRLMWDLEVPLIAAVNGPAVGAGCDLACMADIRIGSENARFAESFVKLGIIPGDGGAWLLQRTVGLSKAAEMTFTGDMIGADEALACGLISQKVPAEGLLDEARALARRIAVNPPHALRMAKRLLRESQQNSLDTVLEMSAAFQALSHEQKDHMEAVEAFFDKRTPSFKGE